MVRIIDIRETTASMRADISNAYVNFSEMTTSVVAVVTDVVRDGRRVVGYGFNSNGRYAVGGLLRERFIPRIRHAAPEDLLDETGANLDPHRIWAVMMTGEKPGGHGERAVAVGTLDMALWDVVAKIAGRPLHRLLAERYRGGLADERVFVYAAGGYFQPGKGLAALQEEMRRYHDLGYTAVKMKIGGAPLADDLARIEAVLAIVGDGQALAVDANGRFDRDTALAYAEALAPYNLRWYEEAGDPSTTTSSRQWRRRTRHPWRPARTSSRCRTRATSSVMAGYAPIAISSNSTRSSATAWSNTCASWTCSARTSGRPGAASRTVATRWP